MSIISSGGPAGPSASFVPDPVVGDDEHAKRRRFAEYRLRTPQGHSVVIVLSAEALEEHVSRNFVVEAQREVASAANASPVWTEVA